MQPILYAAIAVVLIALYMRDNGMFVQGTQKQQQVVETPSQTIQADIVLTPSNMEHINHVEQFSKASRGSTMRILYCTS
jgi:hypothetical protein